MKNSYEILSPFFMKIAGFCISIYLCILCVILFVYNPRYTYWQANAFLVWPIILSAVFLCACFATLIFTKMEESRICLFSMYVLTCIKFVLFLFVFLVRAHSHSDVNIMLKIVLCFSFLFILLEFLHAQTSKAFTKEKAVLSSIIGITSCIVPLLLAILHFFFFMFYIFFAFSIFILTLQGKEVKFSKLFHISIIAFLLILASLVIPNVGTSDSYIILDYIMFLEVLALFCCTQLIPIIGEQTLVDDSISLMQKHASCISSKLYNSEANVGYSNDLPSEVFPMIKGIFMLVIRIFYFTFFAISIAIIWRGI